MYTIPQEELQSGMHILPGHIYSTRTGFSLAWTPLSRSDLSDPFYSDTIIRLSQARLLACEVTCLHQALDRGASLPTIVPAGLILHVSRCGSTALIHALRASGLFVCLSEPQPITQLLSRIVSDSIPLPERSELIQAVTNLYGQLCDSKSPLIVKMASYNLLAFRELRELWPQVPCVILIRNPIEVLVSQLSSQGGWCRRKSDPKWANQLAGVPAKECSAMSSDEFAARVLGRHYDAVYQLSDDRCKIIDYQHFGLSAIKSVVEFFRGVWASALSDQVQRSIATHSLTPNASARFINDRLSKQQLASKQLVAACTSWSSGPYTMLHSISQHELK